MKIIALHKDSPELPKFTAFAEKEAGLFFQPAWTAIYDPQHLQICLIINNNGEAIGCFQYFKFSKAIFNMVITPPFTPSIGIFYRNPAESVVGKNSFSKEILTAIAEYFDQLKSDLTDLALPASIIDTQPFTWRGFQSSLRYSYWIDLNQSDEELWNKLSSQKRQSINKTQKDTISLDLVSDREAVYKLILESLSRNQVLKNQGTIQKIVLNPALQSQSFAFLAKQNDQAISATFCVVSGDSAIYLFGGTAEGNANTGAGVLCMWQSILHAKKLGLKKFDFEGSMQPGIERYFREFGGDLVPYAAIEGKKPLLRAVLNMVKK